MDTNTAKVLGTEAYESNVPRIPAMDPYLMKGLEGLPVGGGGLELMQAWQAGWDKGQADEAAWREAQHEAIADRDWEDRRQAAEDRD